MPEQKRYVAHFQPQVWLNDYALDVDDEGPDEWDCTVFIAGCMADGDIFADYFNEMIEGEGEFLDRDDVLMHDESAPKWVRDWSGPFTITVRLADEQEAM